MYIKYILFLTLSISFVACCQLSTKKKELSQFISPANQNIQYEGRIDFETTSAPKFSYSGVSIEILVNCSKVVVVLSDIITDDDKSNFYTVIINDYPRFILKIDNYKKEYLIADSLPTDKPTKIKLFKRTEASVGPSVFEGFKLYGTSTKINPLPDKKLKFEFIGDSFTTGYGNAQSIPAPPNGNPSTGYNAINQDNYRAWGAIVARNMKANYSCIAYSGRGIFRNNTGFSEGVLPEIYNKIMPDYSDNIWNFTRYKPDVIFINLGINDFMKGVPDSTSFINSYCNFIYRLNRLFPKATLICVTGNGLSDNWPAKEMRWTNYRNFLKSVVKKTYKKNKKTFYLELSSLKGPYGEDWHPSYKAHQLMADEVMMKLPELLKLKK